MTNDLEKRVLQFISILSPALVPRSLLQKILGKQIDGFVLGYFYNPVDEAISKLETHLSMVESDEEDNLSIHRLLAAFIKTRFQPNDPLFFDILYQQINPVLQQS